MKNRIPNLRSLDFRLKNGVVFKIYKGMVSKLLRIDIVIDNQNVLRPMFKEGTSVYEALYRLENGRSKNCSDIFKQSNAIDLLLNENIANEETGLGRYMYIYYTGDSVCSIMYDIKNNVSVPIASGNAQDVWSSLNELNAFLVYDLIRRQNLQTGIDLENNHVL